MTSLPSYLTHYYLPDRKPFQNLCDIEDKQELAEVLVDLQAKTQSGEIRRGFPEWYMKSRLETEKRLRAAHLANDGKLERQSPHYFVLGDNDILAKTHPAMKSVRIVLSEIPSEFLSFTWPDSMATFEVNQYITNPRPYYNKVLILNEMLHWLSIDGFPSGALIAMGKKRFTMMIEAQVWTDEPLIRLGHLSH